MSYAIATSESIPSRSPTREAVYPTRSLPPATNSVSFLSFELSADVTVPTLRQAQVDAIRRLGRIRERLKKRDWIILEKFCGEGWSMAEAVRSATICHRSGVLQRVQEALDELVEARTWRRDALTTA